MKFCTVINCMDGRAQLPVITYLQKRFDAEYVDSVTEAGPDKILAKQNNTALVQGILARLNISVDKHKSVGIAVVGHHDYAGNPAPHDEQITDIKKSVEFLRSLHRNTTVIGLWVDSDFEVHEVVDVEVSG